MKITMNSRIRAYLEKKGPSTIRQVVAALGKHVTATQSMRAYEAKKRHWTKYADTKVQRNISMDRKLEIGRYRVIAAAMSHITKPVGDGTHKLAS